MIPEQHEVEEFHRIAGQAIGDLATPGLAFGRESYDGAHRDMKEGLSSAANTLGLVAKTLAGSGWGLPALRARLIAEEAGEVIAAIAQEDNVELADGLADLLYVLLGTAVSAGIDLGPVFDEVQRSNMAKFPPCPDCVECPRCDGLGHHRENFGLDEPGRTDCIDCKSAGRLPRDCATCGGQGRIVLRDAQGKVQKPAGWTPPDIAAVLARQVKAAQLPRAAVAGEGGVNGFPPCRCHASTTDPDWWRKDVRENRCEAPATHYDYDLHESVCAAHIVQPEFSSPVDAPPKSQDGAGAAELPRHDSIILGGGWLWGMLQHYEDQSEPEARFVRLVDKIVPKLTNLQNGCVAVRRLTDEAGFLRSHTEQLAKLRSAYGAEFPETILLLEAAMEAAHAAWPAEEQGGGPDLEPASVRTRWTRGRAATGRTDAEQRTFDVDALCAILATRDVPRRTLIRCPGCDGYRVQGEGCVVTSCRYHRSSS